MGAGGVVFMRGVICSIDRVRGVRENGPPVRRRRRGGRSAARRHAACRKVTAAAAVTFPRPDLTQKHAESSTTMGGDALSSTE